MEACGRWLGLKAPGRGCTPQPHIMKGLAPGALSLWPCWQGQLVTAVGWQPLNFFESEGAREICLQDDKRVNQVVLCTSTGAV